MFDLTDQSHLDTRDRPRECYISTMRSTIDSAGRLVIPKAIRDRLGLMGGQPVKIRERDGVIEIEPEPMPMNLADRDGVLVAVPEDEIAPLTDDIVRITIERTRR